jgi:LPXTG-site transpeptidase (sortase) family protein
MLATFLAFKVFAKPAVQSVKTAAPITNVVSKPAKTASYRGLPIRLKIPAIGVDTAIEYMGNTAGGDMAAPNSLVNAGWYKFGPLPGETGSAVIAGHVVGFKDEPGVFKQLDKLKAGDTLLVIDAKGQSASFTVREARTYDPKQQHDEVFNSASGMHLNLITCAGDWDSSHQHYLKRLVVFADLSPAV